MIRFACPTCQKALKAPDNGVGRKVSCPRCGQWLLVPPPVQLLNQTVLGQPMPDPATPPPPNPFNFESMSSGPDEEGGAVHRPLARNDDAARKHSGLGIASFLIAMLVGGMDVILALVIAVNAAGSARGEAGLGHVAGQLVGGGLAMYCMNLMSVPLCLVGLGMALVGLVAHRGHNHLFTWLGLLGNGVVILGVVGLYVFGSVVVNGAAGRPPPRPTPPPAWQKQQPKWVNPPDDGP